MEQADDIFPEDMSHMILGQEPEAEDEAQGWMIVEPVAAEKRPRAQSASLAEVPEDLVMGCLDPECDAFFDDACEQWRCGSCRLPFCERHVVSWPLRGARSRSPSSSFDLSTGGGGSSGSSSTAMVATAPVPQANFMPAASEAWLLEFMGVPAGAAAFLCRECRNSLTPAVPAVRLGPVPGSPRLSPLPVTNMVDVSALANEAQVLLTKPLANLKDADENEEPSRTVARALLLKRLTRLRTLYRPWGDQERTWIWSLREDLVEEHTEWLLQFARQVRWSIAEEAQEVARLIEKTHTRRKLDAREMLQLLGILGRNATVAVTAIGERRLGLIATFAAEAAVTLDGAELACCLELLLDAGEALGAAGATGGRRAVVGMLLKAANGAAAGAACLRGELFWALEARGSTVAPSSMPALQPLGTSSTEPRAWAKLALEELLRDQPPDVELGLMRQRAWVRHAERFEIDASRVEPGWGEARAFPVAVWPPQRRCLGLLGHPKETASKNAPVILRCACRDAGCSSSSAPKPALTTKAAVTLGSGSAAGRSSSSSAGNSSTASSPGTTGAGASEQTAGLLLKRDAGMHREQQVGQTLRLLERLIWEPKTSGQAWEHEGLELPYEILEREGLTLEEIRATYKIAMTGPGTALVEFVDNASTLRDVRAGRAMPRGRVFSQNERGNLLKFLEAHCSKDEIDRAKKRLAFTAAISAVLSFVAGLGDRHHENFMVTTTGILLHIDYGYALGREPLDSVLIHKIVQSERPAVMLQYEELIEVLDRSLVSRVFWPVVQGAYLRVRQHAGLMLEMVHTAMVRDSRRYSWADSNASWKEAQAFVERCCATALPAPSAKRFIHALLWHCARHERGTQFRDELKNLGLRENIREKGKQASAAASSVVRAGARWATYAATGSVPAIYEASSMAKGVTAGTVTGFLSGMRDLWGGGSGAGAEGQSQGFANIVDQSRCR
mmetsp:Transcript_106208/g.193279  ORF Transcript_106208/g.193279 Transcript_106208/m.193279 type:complete len:957 (+) Transcript_106208:108-2978(+)